MTVRSTSNSRGFNSMCNVQKKRRISKTLVGGCFFLLVSFTMCQVDVLDIITEFVMRIEEGSFLYRMWANPPFQLQTDVYIFNYTNTERFLKGLDDKLKVEEIGPFVYQELRVNQNLTVDHNRKVMSMIPNTTLKFEPEKSITDSKKIFVNVPSLALLALTTLATDNLPMWSNIFLSTYTSGSKLFLNLTADEYLLGYSDSIISFASTLFPGWIDFEKIGILDRFYDQKPTVMEVDISSKETRFQIQTWDHSAVLKERLTDPGIPCNTVKGTYEGFMLSPNLRSDKMLNIFRKQGCRVYPFEYAGTFRSDKTGLDFYRYELEEWALDKSSNFSCPCTEQCPLDGSVDISSCFYRFPIVLSLPHFYRAEQKAFSNFEGLIPDGNKHLPYLDYEPILGAPVSYKSVVQVNMAVRTSPYNRITEPLHKLVLPLMWINFHFEDMPEDVLKLIKARVKYAPWIFYIIKITLFFIGVCLVCVSIYEYHSFKRTTHSSVSSMTETNDTVDPLKEENGRLLKIRGL